MTTADQSHLHPVVCRFEGMHPSDLQRYEFHRKRLGGDIGHVDPSRTHLNTRLIGKEDWADRALDLLEARKAENFADELTSLKRRKRKKDMMRRIAEGPYDPWRPTRHGPLREVILTANKAWFDQFEVVNGEVDFEARERIFEKTAISWLKDNFGEAVIHARADRDEAAYHVHAVIACWARVKIKSTKHSGVERWMLQPSANPLIEDYEKAQDSVGKAFASIGLTRGECRKQAFRDAIAKGEMPPPRRMHVRPVAYRRSEDIRQDAEKTRLEAEAARVANREAVAEAQLAEGEAIIAGAEGISDGSLEVADTEAGPELRPTSKTAESPALQSRLARLRGSPRGHGRIAQAMAAAFKRITARSEVVAEARAQRKLARDFANMEAAQDTITGIAELIPENLSKRVTEARRKLFAQLFGLRTSLGSSGAETGVNGTTGQAPDDRGEEK